MRSLVLLSMLLAGPVAAQNACDECRSTALHQSTVCHAAAVTPTEAADCGLKLQDAREKCQVVMCKAEGAARLYALCPECAKLRGPERARCEKNLCAPAQTKGK